MISMRLLLAEDDPNVRYMFRRFMGDLTSKIVEKDTLRGAIEASEQEDFDVIILDLRLLDSDFEETLTAIPQLRRRSNAPVIVVTGIPDPRIEERAKAAGADFAIQKQDAFTKEGRAVLLALHAAVVKHPRPHAGDSYLRHVEMLERLVHAG